MEKPYEEMSIEEKAESILTYRDAKVHLHPIRHLFHEEEPRRTLAVGKLADWVLQTLVTYIPNARQSEAHEHLEEELNELVDLLW